MSEALNRLVDALTAHGCKPNSKGEAKCPAHDDQRASLSVHEGDKGAVVKCHAGCQLTAILSAVSLTAKDLFNENGNGKREVAAYDYVDEAGKLLYQVVRFDPKDFRQRRPDGAGDWIWKMGNTRRVLYRLPQVIEAVAAKRTVYVLEGEKDVATVVGWGLDATCNPGGAGKWKPEYSDTLRGARVVIIADADKAGREHAASVASALQGVASNARVVEMPGAKDVTAWAATGATRERFEALMSGSEGQTDEIVTVTAADLQTRRFSPPKEIMPGLLISGLFLLAGAPKLGKSWLALLLAAAKAMGGEALGVKMQPSPVLFAGLEDGMRRLQGRLHMMIGGEERWPANLHLADAVSWPWRGTDAVDRMRRWHDKHPTSEMMVVDTLARLRPGTGKQRGSAYELDVEFAAPFQTFAIEREICVFANVHTRKQNLKYRELDGLEAVSGTLGLPGTADGVLVLQRGRLAKHGDLLVTGRDIPERKLALEFDPTNGMWSYVGEAEYVEANALRQITIDAMREEGQAMTVKQIATATGSKYENTKKLVKGMLEKGQIVRFGPHSYVVPTISPSLSSPLYPKNQLTIIEEGEKGEGDTYSEEF
jgi:hypothetical protein